MKRMLQTCCPVFLFTVLVLNALASPAGAQLAIEPGDHVLVVGNTFSERMAQSGYFDSVVHAAHPDGKIMIRHAPNSADEVAMRERERAVPTMEDNLKKYGADVIVMCFGMSESFAGPEGLADFGRQLARRILQTSDASEVKPAIDAWLQAMNPRDPSYDAMLLEALWVVQGMGEIDLALLDETLRARTPEARAGALRVLRFWMQLEQVGAEDAQRFLASYVVDPDMRVRLEAVVACGFLDSPSAISLVELSTNMPMDGGMQSVVENTLTYLNPRK